MLVIVSILFPVCCSSLLKEPVCAVLHSALSPLHETVYGEQLGSVLANVENGMFFTIILL